MWLDPLPSLKILKSTPVPMTDFYTLHWVVYIFEEVESSRHMSLSLCIHTKTQFEYLSCHIYKSTFHPTYHWYFWPICLLNPWQSKNEIDNNQRQRPKRNLEKSIFATANVMVTFDPKIMGYSFLIYYMKGNFTRHKTISW